MLYVEITECFVEASEEWREGGAVAMVVATMMVAGGRGGATVAIAVGSGWVCDK